MTDERRLLCVVAHPDDETLGCGGMLARYAAEGVVTAVVSATRGERGWQGDPADDPGPEALGTLREQELRAAASLLGVGEVTLLGYPDGEVDRADPAEAIAQVVDQIRRVRPQVVVTFPPDGITGHPDHIAISQIATAAVVCATDASCDDCSPHRVAKLYYLAPSRETLALYSAALGDPAMVLDGEVRRTLGWPAWAITTRVDATTHWQQVCRAIACHQSQLTDPEELDRLPAETHRRLWGTQELYRVFNLAAGAGAYTRVEDDLFMGLR